MTPDCGWWAHFKYQATTVCETMTSSSTDEIDFVSYNEHSL